jgi:hypothetical protein
MAMTATKIKESRAVSVLLPLSVLTSHRRQVLVLIIDVQTVRAARLARGTARI